MLRWLEEFELTHADFIRCIQHFDSIHSIWQSIATKASKPGYAAFARRQSAIYKDLRDDAKSLFAKKGEPRFVNIQVSEMVPVVQSFRELELGWLAELAKSNEFSRMSE
jgi:hypothetical protein